MKSVKGTASRGATRITEMSGLCARNEHSHDVMTLADDFRCRQCRSGVAESADLLPATVPESYIHYES